jgi:phage terminase large subunit
MGVRSLDAIRRDYGELFNRLGYSEVSWDDMVNLQVRYLECLGGLWPYTLRRFEAEQAGEIGREISVEEGPIIGEAKDVLKALGILRAEWVRGIGELVVDDGRRARYLGMCKENLIHFINYWCFVHEPRNVELGLPTTLPFVLYPAQERVGLRIEHAFNNRQDLLVEKSRGAGISWEFCAAEVHHWLFYKGYRSILGSQKEEKVDSGASVDTLFGKLRYIIYRLPVWMRPPGYEKFKSSYDTQRALINPGNHSEIIGEIGDNIGRSGRASRIIIDESQDIEHAEVVAQSVEGVTNCRIDVGTPNGMNFFGMRRHSGKVPVESIWWYEDPRKNPEWKRGKFNKECAWRRFIEATKDTVFIAQNYDIDYQASVQDAVIPSEWVKAAIDFDLPVEGDRAAGFDVAAGGKNDSIYVSRIGPCVISIQKIPLETSTEALLKAIQLATDDEVELFNYDADGIGRSVIGELKQFDLPIRFMINGIRGNDKVSDENKKYFNKRAELWWSLRERFFKTYEHRKGIRIYGHDELISIPNDPVLVQQISQPKQKFRGARVSVESKIEMRTRGVASPDRADALVYCFASPPSQIVGKFDYTSDSRNLTCNGINHITSAGEQYVSIIQSADLSLHAIVCLWRPRNLTVYAELTSNPPDVGQFVTDIKDSAQHELKPVKEWIGCGEMFDGMEKGKIKMWHLFRKAGVALRRNYSDDRTASIAIVNKMFAEGTLVVHNECGRLIEQLVAWESQDGIDDGRRGLALALCQLITRLRQRRKLERVSGGRLLYGKFSKRNQGDYVKEKVDKIREEILCTTK